MIIIIVIIKSLHALVYPWNGVPRWDTDSPHASSHGCRNISLSLIRYPFLFKIYLCIPIFFYYKDCGNIVWRISITIRLCVSVQVNGLWTTIITQLIWLIRTLFPFIDAQVLMVCPLSVKIRTRRQDLWWRWFVWKMNMTCRVSLTPLPICYCMNTSLVMKKILEELYCIVKSWGSDGCQQDLSLAWWLCWTGNLKQK